MNLPVKSDPVLMSEPNVHSKEQRAALTEILFESLDVPSFFVCKSAVLACFATGRSMGIVYDSGSSKTEIVPVVDGYIQQKNIIRSELGGEYFNERVRSYIENDLRVPIVPSYNFTVKNSLDEKKVEYLNLTNVDPYYAKMAILDVAREVKEHLLKVHPFKSENFAKDQIEYELPDGKQIYMRSEAYTIPEALFNPDLIKEGSSSSMKEEAGKIDTKNYYFKGAYQMIAEAVNRADIDIRRELYSNIILCGGNTLFGNFSERLEKHLADVVPQSIRVKLISYPSSAERKFATWLGGSILASISSFQNLWVTKMEYNEHGSSIMEKKCP